MKRFTKNVLHGLSHFCIPSGRDSRQTFCDIYKGFILLALFGVFVCVWRNTLAVMFVRDWLAISELGCWIMCGIFELFLLVAFTCAVMRRWQDLDIRIPKDDSFGELIQRPRFWKVLAREEGSSEKNQYGEAPADNPVPLVDEKDLKEALRKKLFIGLDEWEELKK